MATMEVGMNGIVARNLPAVSQEGMEGKVRVGRYREQYALSLVPTKHLLADEGGYYVASNQSPGTGVQMQGLVTAFSSTAGIAHIFNTETTETTGKRIYFDYLKLILQGTAPTGTVSMEFALAIDTLTREPSAANRTLLTPKNVNSAVGTASVAQVSQYLAANAFTLQAASGNVRYVRGHIPTGLGITGDEYILKCGGEDMQAVPGLTAARSAAPGRYTGYCAPVVIGPAQSLSIHFWWLTEATTNPTFELEMGWWER